MNPSSTRGRTASRGSSLVATRGSRGRGYNPSPAGSPPKNTLSIRVPSPPISPEPKSSLPHNSPTPLPLDPTQALQPKMKKKPVDFSSPQSFVTVVVDKDASKKTFVIHKCLISYHSPFFQKTFTRGFLEGETQSMTIEDIDSSTFGLMVHWMYIQEFRDAEVEQRPVILLLAKVWVLAERFLMPRLQNAVLEKFQSRLSFLFEAIEPVVQFVYAADKPKDNPFRKLIVQKFVYNTRGDWQARVDQLPAEFVADVLTLLIGFHDRQPARFHGKIAGASEMYVEVKEDES